MHFNRDLGIIEGTSEQDPPEISPCVERGAVDWDPDGKNRLGSRYRLPRKRPCLTRGRPLLTHGSSGLSCSRSCLPCKRSRLTRKKPGLFLRRFCLTDSRDGHILCTGFLFCRNTCIGTALLLRFFPCLGYAERSCGKKPPLSSDLQFRESRSDLSDPEIHVDQVLLRGGFALRRRPAQSTAAHSLPVGFQCPLRPGPGHASFRPAGPALHLQDQGLHCGFVNCLFHPAGGDEEFFHILQIPLLHGEASVQRPVLLRCQDIFKPAAVKKACSLHRILPGKGRKLLL